MKKFYFVPAFIATHIFFIFFQIHKHSKVIHLSYNKQKGEQQKEQLTQQIQQLTQKLYGLKERSAIKKYAQQKMGMRKVRLSQVKKLDLNYKKTDLSGEVLRSTHAKEYVDG